MNQRVLIASHLEGLSSLQGLKKQHTLRPPTAVAAIGMFLTQSGCSCTMLSHTMGLLQSVPLSQQLGLKQISQSLFQVSLTDL